MADHLDREMTSSTEWRTHVGRGGEIEIVLVIKMTISSFTVIQFSCGLDLDPIAVDGTVSL